MFGWFSKAQASAFGFAIYKSINGGTVRVSEVTDDHRQPSKWNDVEYVGEVVEFVVHHPVDACEELTEQDIISEENLILTDANHKNAKRDWVSVFAKQVNVRALFGASALIADKHSHYYGAD
jgi:hypothetical protein